MGVINNNAGAKAASTAQRQPPEAERRLAEAEPQMQRNVVIHPQ